MKVAIVGATGMVGNVMLKVLDEHNLPLTQLLVVASEKSVGKTLNYRNIDYTIIGLQNALEAKPDIAIFSAGGVISKEWAPKFASNGTVVIDNSSTWRMERPLIVPEINGKTLSKHDKIIANPNCSTIQMVLALFPLHKRYGVKRIVVSTYQSVSGTGVQAVEQMNNERKGLKGKMVYPYPIDRNCLPHGGDFDNEGNTAEETKLLRETRKILGDDTIGVTATVVRVPVTGGHSEAINVEFKSDFDLSEVRRLLGDQPGITLQDNPDVNLYPMPKYAEGKDDVFVGRIRRDNSQANTLNIWVVADNLRKGAATNALQIADYIIKNNLIE